MPGQLTKRAIVARWIAGDLSVMPSTPQANGKPHLAGDGTLRVGNLSPELPALTSAVGKVWVTDGAGGTEYTDFPVVDSAAVVSALGFTPANDSAVVHKTGDTMSGPLILNSGVGYGARLSEQKLELGGTTGGVEFSQGFHYGNGLGAALRYSSLNALKVVGADGATLGTIQANGLAMYPAWTSNQLGVFATGSLGSQPITVAAELVEFRSQYNEFRATLGGYPVGGLMVNNDLAFGFSSNGYGGDTNWKRVSPNVSKFVGADGTTLGTVQASQLHNPNGQLTIKADAGGILASFQYGTNEPFRVNYNGLQVPRNMPLRWIDVDNYAGGSSRVSLLPSTTATNTLRVLGSNDLTLGAIQVGSVNLGGPVIYSDGFSIVLNANYESTLFQWAGSEVARMTLQGLNVGDGKSISFTNNAAAIDAYVDARLKRVGVGAIGIYQANGTTRGNFQAANVTAFDDASNYWKMSGQNLDGVDLGVQTILLSRAYGGQILLTSAGKMSFSDGSSVYSVVDAQLGRRGVGQLGVFGNNGLAVRNLLNDADAPLSTSRVNFTALGNDTFIAHTAANQLSLGVNNAARVQVGTNGVRLLDTGQPLSLMANAGTAGISLTTNSSGEGYFASHSNMQLSSNFGDVTVYAGFGTRARFGSVIRFTHDSGVAVRNAANNADAPITASTITASNRVIAGESGVSGGFYFSNGVNGSWFNGSTHFIGRADRAYLEILPTSVQALSSLKFVSAGLTAMEVTTGAATFSGGIAASSDILAARASGNVQVEARNTTTNHYARLWAGGASGAQSPGVFTFIDGASNPQSISAAGATFSSDVIVGGSTSTSNRSLSILNTVGRGLVITATGTGSPGTSLTTTGPGVCVIGLDSTVSIGSASRNIANLGNDGANYFAAVWARRFSSSGPSGEGETVFASGSLSDAIHFQQGTTPIARFAGTTGNLLLGTSTDNGSKLNVNGAITASGSVTVANPATGANEGAFVQLTNNTVNPGLLMLLSSTYSGQFSVVGPRGLGLYSGSAGGIALVSDGGGSIRLARSVSVPTVEIPSDGNSNFRNTVSQGFNSVTPSFRSRMMATGQQTFEIGNGSGTWQGVMQTAYGAPVDIGESDYGVRLYGLVEIDSNLSVGSIFASGIAISGDLEADNGFFSGTLSASTEIQQGYNTLTPSYRSRMLAVGKRASEVGDGAGAWQTGLREEYNAGGYRMALYGATPVAKQTFSMSTGTLADLATILSNLGAITLVA